MRLIDAEKLVESLQEWDTPESKSLYNFAIERIIRQPIVFDTDKVESRLTERAQESAGDFSEFQDGYYAGMEAGFRQAIQIVKGGGVDG